MPKYKSSPLEKWIQILRLINKFAKKNFKDYKILIKEWSNKIKKKRKKKEINKLKAKNLNIKFKDKYKHSIIPEIFTDLDKNFIALDIVKKQLRSITDLLFLESLIPVQKLSFKALHMAFTGNSGTGKSSVARKIGEILRDLNYISKGHLITVSREDLVGEYVGHTAPKTREILQKAKGGILFIDETSQLYKASNEKDYGSEAIEIILQTMENKKKDLVFIFSDQKDRLDEFFNSNPGISSRIGHYIDFQNYTLKELTKILFLLLNKEGKYYLENSAQDICYINISKEIIDQNFANTRTLELLAFQLIEIQSKRLLKYKNFKLTNDLTLKNLLAINIEDIIDHYKKI